VLDLFSDEIWEEIATKYCDVRAAIRATTPRPGSGGATNGM